MSSADRLEMRVPADLKRRLRRAAAARGVSITRFALDAIERALDVAFEPDGSRARRELGWAAGTAVQNSDIVGPAADPGEWDALSG